MKPKFINSVIFSVKCAHFLKIGCFLYFHLSIDQPLINSALSELRPRAFKSKTSVLLCPLSALQSGAGPPCGDEIRAFTSTDDSPGDSAGAQLLFKPH